MILQMRNGEQCPIDFATSGKFSVGISANCDTPSRAGEAHDQLELGGLICHCDVESKRGTIRRVKYWKAILAILAVLSASIALAEDFKTINGKEYKNATVSRVEPDGIVLKTKSGISKVYFTELPKDVQQRFQHDFAQGAHFTAGDNTASGLNTLFSNTTGSNNTADGSAALATNTTGFQTRRPAGAH
jgi:hypothetical protein